MNLNQIPLFAMLSNRLSWLTQRQQVLADNIANADTPGYKPNDLEAPDFEKLARNAGRTITMAGTNGRYLSGASTRSGSFRVQEADGIYESTPSGNAVVLEEQLMKVSQTAMDHRMIASLYTKHLGMIKAALGRT